jgi:VIT1/CCC1 family predicted Fe2+/Mn2+ transporter
VQVVGHLLEGDRELQAMIGHSLLQAVYILIAGAVSALSVLGALRSVINGARQLPQPLSMLLLKGASFLQEG